MRIDDGEFNRVCRLASLVEVHSKVPTWTNQGKTEGIELKGNKIIPFHIFDGNREYDQIITDNKILTVIGAFERELTENHQEIKGIPIQEIVAGEIDRKEAQVNNNAVALFPDNLTKQLYEKWQNMTVPERLIMLQNTDKRYIKERPGKAGQKYNYVEGHYMVMAANMAFAYQWSSNVEKWHQTDQEIVCMGFIEAEINGKTIRKYAVGQKDIAFKKNTKEVLCIGDDYKSAEMDMIKKALSFFGIAKDVYSNEV